MTTASTTPRICQDCAVPLQRKHGHRWPERCPVCAEKRNRQLTRAWCRQHRRLSLRFCECETPIAAHVQCTACGTLCGPWLADPTNPAISVHVWRPEALDAAGRCPSCVRAAQVRAGVLV